MDEVKSEQVEIAPTLATPPPVPEMPGDLPAGTLVDGYRIVRLIGRGGMGTVYAAQDKEIDRLVAIKVLSAELAERADFVARFETEVRATVAIGHPNIIIIFQCGVLPTVPRQPYFVMEYLPGQSLEDRLEHGPLSVAEARKLLGAFDALEAAHRAGIIHRDLKPDNLWLGSAHGERFIKILDFGIAKLMTPSARSLRTRTGSAMGTPHFMSPEQWAGKEVDKRTDVYAMGVVLYSAFTGGKFPFDAATPQALSIKLMTEKPTPPSHFSKVDRKLERLILKCLERDPMQRPQSAAEVRAKLDTILARLERGRHWPERWGYAGIGVLALCALLAMLRSAQSIAGPPARPPTSVPSVLPGVARPEPPVQTNRAPEQADDASPRASAAPQKANEPPSVQPPNPDAAATAPMPHTKLKPKPSARGIPATTGPMPLTKPEQPVIAPSTASSEGPLAVSAKAAPTPTQAATASDVWHKR